MRKLFILITFFLVSLTALTQELVNYKDTINRISINLPIGWKYGVNKNFPSLILIAYRAPSNLTDTSRESLNMNVIDTPQKDLDKTFSGFIQSLADAKNFKLIETGDRIINGIKCKWLIETHTNSQVDLQMHNYDFVTLKDGKTFVLTMVCFSRSFDSTKPLFDRIAESFTFLN